MNYAKGFIVFFDGLHFVFFFVFLGIFNVFGRGNWHAHFGFAVRLNGWVVCVFAVFIGQLCIEFVFFLIAVRHSRPPRSSATQFPSNP